MNRFTRNQGDLNIKPGDIIYTVNLDKYYLPSIAEIYVTGYCDNDRTYDEPDFVPLKENIMGYNGKTAFNDWIIKDDNDEPILDESGNLQYNRDIHTCNMTIFKTKREAIKYGQELVKKEIKRLKKLQSEVGSQINGFLYWQKHKKECEFFKLDINELTRPT